MWCPLVMFSAPRARCRGTRDCAWGCVRPACELWMSRVVSPRYVFGTPGTMPGHSRLRVGLSVACVRGVGARVGTLVVLLHDLRACHSAYASGLVSQGGWRETAPYFNLQAPNCHFPAHPLVSCAFGVVFGSSLPTVYLLRPYETPPRTGYFAEYFSFPLKWQAASSIC